MFIEGGSIELIKANYKSLLLSAIISIGLPISIIDNMDFARFIYYLDKDIRLPSASTIKNRLLKRGFEIRLEIIAKLLEDGIKIVITLDS